MATNERAVGHTRRVAGYATGHDSGDLLIHNAWPGVVLKNIKGTTEALTTIDGREIVGEYGDGVGDIQVEGVFKVVDETYPASTLADGDAVDRNSASGVIAAAVAANRMGHVMGDPWIEDSIQYVAVKLLGRPNV